MITECTATSGWGGGMGISSHAERVVLNRTVVLRNSALYGGGLSLVPDESVPLLLVASDSSSIPVVSSSTSGDVLDVGAAVTMADPSGAMMVLEDVVVSGNSAGRYGGGVERVGGQHGGEWEGRVHVGCSGVWSGA